MNDLILLIAYAFLAGCVLGMSLATWERSRAERTSVGRGTEEHLAAPVSQTLPPPSLEKKLKILEEEGSTDLGEKEA